MPSESLVQARDCGGTKALLGNPSQTASSGANGSLITTRAWQATLKRETRRSEVTATGIFHMQAVIAAVSDRDPASMMPLMAPSDMIYRLRECIAAEYVSGAGVSRVGWGTFITWNADIRGAPAALLDQGFIGFLWYQVGSVSTNWRAVAAAHDGTNVFDVDTGKVAPDVPYNLRIDVDGHVGKRKIVYFIDEIEVASFTPGDDVLGGISVANLLVGSGVNAQNGNVCAVNAEMLGENGWELLVQEGTP